MTQLEIDPLALEITNELNEEKRCKTGTWEHENLAQLRYKVLRGHLEGINSAKFCKNDSCLVTASDDKSCALWNTSTGDKLQKYEGATMQISQCHLSSDDRLLAGACWDKNLYVWDSETGQILWKGLHAGIVMCCDFSHSSNLIASASDLDFQLHIWDVREKSSVKNVKGHHKSTITSCKFSPNDDRVATTSMDKSTKLWDRINEQTTVTLGDHSNVISCCCFTSNERRLCTGSWDKQLQVWDVSTGIFRSKGPTTFSKGHEGSISSCCFSKDGTILVSGAYDQTVVVWDADNCGPKLTLKGHTDWVTDVDFSQDQNWILSCSKDKTIRLWNIANSDKIPLVLENKRNMGLQIVKCQHCGKPFSISQVESSGRVDMCVFCRMQAGRKEIMIENELWSAPDD
ncbi:WD repeat-containing protein 88-like [Anneissia japonica]|uniref:WD repeat-containing protein 88-like n=1 Tax=Anneissia japonica TaxID=1529436 RepID=UPI0014257278|nr:WD repeat-containing protein 88-like [Anneissia japonica]